MLSAGSAAPYDSAVVGLTTWDQDLVVGGVTYLKGRITALAKAAASSGDASRGQGGFASPLELSLTIADRCAAGRLWPLVESGAVPLVGAEVRILNESGDMAPQTWYLHEPKLDGGSIKFVLKTMRYLCTKPIAWSAMRYDGAAAVGLAVGDAAVQGINAAGRYKGVSVPTKAFASWQPLQYKNMDWIGYGGVPGDPSPKVWSLGTHPYDKSGTSPHYYFDFVFGPANDSTDRDAFVLKYFGDQTSDKKYGIPNSCLVVSDGTNFETICTADSDGLLTYSKYTSIVLGVRNFTTRDKHYTIQIWADTSGNLINSDASSIQLYCVQANSPICSGAQSLVGFQSKASGSEVYGVVDPDGVVSSKNETIYFSPTNVTSSGFVSWTALKNTKGFLYGGFNDESYGAIKYSGGAQKISTDPLSAISENECFQMYYEYTHPKNAGGPLNSTVYIDIRLINRLSALDIDIDVSQVIVDPVFRVQVSAKSAQPFSGTSWVDMLNPFVASAGLSASVTGNDADKIFGPSGPDLHNTRVFASLADVSGANDTRFQVHAYAAGFSDDVVIFISQWIYKIILWGKSTLAFGSNPAVVIPGSFPGTSNPTTTPAMAIDQLAAWAGLSVIKTGGWTPSPGVWGRYLGPDPSSNNSADALTVTQAIDNLANEAWMWVAEGSAPAVAPTIESMTPPVLDTSSIDDVVTLPQISYDYAGTSAQYTAKILNVDQPFDASKGDGYFWGGWQEKDACHFSAAPTTGSVLAMAQLDDCLAVVDSLGYLRCSYDGGTTWPFSAFVVTVDNAVDATFVCGGGVMLAIATKYSGATRSSCAYISADAGRTWPIMSALNASLIFGGWYDEAVNRFWLCGANASGLAAIWYSEDGSTWTEIDLSNGVSTFTGTVTSVCAVGSSIILTFRTSAYYVWASTDLGASWTTVSALPQGEGVELFLGRWNSIFRVAVGTTLYSSSDLSAWASVATPAPLQAFATDGAVVVGISPDAGAGTGSRIAYSRDHGATWKLLRVSPENTAWAILNPISIWDDENKCFRLSAWGPNRLIALGDPSVLDIWLQCRASYIKTQTLHTETYDWAGVYDADVVVSMLLDAKDGIDAEYQQSRIDWMTKQARFATLKVEFADIVEQLSLTAFQKIAIPRQRLEDSLLAGNVPTYGLLTSVEPDPMTGISTIETIMPPL